MTVGTSLPHDALIEKMDRLVEEGRLQDKVVAQIGEGGYVPKNIGFFRFAPSLEDLFEEADVIVSNCGAGTIMENVTKGRPLVVIQNPAVTGGHEWELVRRMEQDGHLIWCRSLQEIPDCIVVARAKDFVPFSVPRLDLGRVLREIIPNPQS